MDHHPAHPRGGDRHLPQAGGLVGRVARGVERVGVEEHLQGLNIGLDASVHVETLSNAQKAEECPDGRERSVTTEIDLYLEYGCVVHVVAEMLVPFLTVFVGKRVEGIASAKPSKPDCSSNCCPEPKPPCHRNHLAAAHPCQTIVAYPHRHGAEANGPVHGHLARRAPDAA